MTNSDDKLYETNNLASDLGFYPESSDKAESHATEEDVKNAYEELRKSVLSELNAFFELQLKSTVFLGKQFFEIAEEKGKELAGDNHYEKDYPQKYIDEENKNPAIKYLRSTNRFDEWLPELVEMAKYTENDWKQYVAQKLKSMLDKKFSGFMREMYLNSYKDDNIFNTILKNCGTEEIARIKEAATKNNVPPVFVKAISHLYEFDDIIRLDDRAIQMLLREVDSFDLAIALKTAKEEIKEKFFRNMSQRASSLLKEDMEYMKSVRKKDAVAAQNKVLEAMYLLSERGDIEIPCEADDEV